MKQCILIIFLTATAWLYSWGQVTQAVYYKSDSIAFDNAVSLQTSGLVVRVPTQQNKLKYLRGQLNNTTLSKTSKKQIQALLDETIAENKDHLQELIQGFDEYWTISKVYYVPDSLYKSFVDGSRNVFLNVDNGVQGIKNIGLSNEYFQMLNDGDKTKLILVDANGIRLDEPFPHKKNVFLPAFKKILNKKKFLHDQIKWMNKRILNVLNYKHEVK